MKTLATAFKEVYGEALKKYGFKKIKGKYPYYVRVIGDEIVHVITYREERCTDRNKKSFSILAGIATVFRNKINFDISPKDNVGWLNSNAKIYVNLNTYDYDNEYRCSIMFFEYQLNDEKSLTNSLMFSLDITKKHILPELYDVVNINQCMEYYQKHNPNLLFVYTDETFGTRWNGGEYNEGLLNFVTYNAEEFADYKRKLLDKSNEHEKYQIDSGKSGLTNEEHKKNIQYRELKMNEQILEFENAINNFVVRNRIMKELEQRKGNNIEILRKYGVL